MTYCVAMLLDTGLVFLSDSRTSAGVDHISTFRKTTVLQKPGERVLVLQTAGNLAITQAVTSMLRDQIDVARNVRAPVSSPVRPCSRPPSASAKRCAKCIGVTPSP